jgi:hypothetical protein
MKRRFVASGAVLAAFALAGGMHTAEAADPTTADCLGASEAALKFGSELKLRAERAQLLVCAAASCPADIRKECDNRIEEVNTQIPTIIFQAKDGAGKDLSAVKVTMDGEVLAERLQGAALSIDPGSHTFTFEMAGQPVVNEQLLIQEGDKDRREHIVLGASGTTVGTPAGAPVPASIPPVPAQSAAGSGLGAQKTLGLVAAGVGVVGVGLGSAFGLIAMSKRDDAQRICPNQCTGSDGANAWKDAGAAGTASTVLFVVGGAALAGAAVLWFTAPSSGREPSAQVGLGFGGVQMKGTW